MELLRAVPWRDKRPILLGQVLLVPFLLFSLPVRGDISVFMPNVRPPYVAIFEEIIAGIRSVSPRDISVHVLDDADHATISGILASKPRNNAVVALGPSTSRALAAIVDPFSLVVGAIPPALASQLGPVSGIHLAPSPRIIFSELKRLAPEIETVYVVQVDPHLQALIDAAIVAAEQSGLNVVVRRADSRISAAREYREIMQSMRSKTHALWLLDEATMDADATLPAILRQAWDSDLIVVSNNLQHVSRGALMALYPDNRELGQALARLALDIHGADEISRGAVVPLEAVRRALNRRTVRHLRLDIGPADESRFDLVFPRR